MAALLFVFLRSKFFSDDSFTVFTISVISVKSFAVVGVRSLACEISLIPEDKIFVVFSSKDVNKI